MKKNLKESKRPNEKPKVAKAKNGAVKDLPLLDYDYVDEKSFTVAYTNWLLALYTYVGVHYVDMKFVFDEKYPRYPTQPTVDTSDLYREPSTEETNMYKERGENPPTHMQVYDNLVHQEIIKRRMTISENLREEYRVQRGKMYTLVMGKIGDPTKNLITTCKEYEETDKHQNDPLAFLRMVKKVHTSRGVVDDAETRRYEAQRQFNQTYNNDGQPLIEFKIKYEATITGLREAGAPMPSDRDLAHKFVERLNRKAFLRGYDYYKSGLVEHFENVEAAFRWFTRQEKVRPPGTTRWTLLMCIEPKLMMEALIKRKQNPVATVTMRKIKTSLVITARARAITRTNVSSTSAWKINKNK